MPRVEPAGDPQARGVLALQKAAGNRAVSGLVQRAIDPQVETADQPYYRDRGGILWQVDFAVPGEHGEGWVVQEIDADLTAKNGEAAQKHHFWEAWYLKKNAATSEKPRPNDSYQAPPAKAAQGANRIKGTARFYERAETGAGWRPWEPDLPGFSKNSGTWANDLLATTKEPKFWTGGGTDHDLDVDWDPKTGTSEPRTTPAAKFKKIENFSFE